MRTEVAVLDTVGNYRRAVIRSDNVNYGPRAAKSGRVNNLAELEPLQK